MMSLTTAISTTKMNKKKTVAGNGRRMIRIRSEYRMLILVACALVLAAVFRFCVITPVRIVGDSMLPSLAAGDWVLADPQAYRDDLPARGDLVLISRRELTKGYIVKRVVGLPGERIEIRSGVLYVDDVAMPENYGTYVETGDFGPIYVDENCFFVLGDNRNVSNDSRHWKEPLVEMKELRGKIVYQVFPEIRRVYD